MAFCVRPQLKHCLEVITQKRVGENQLTWTKNSFHVLILYDKGKFSIWRCLYSVFPRLYPIRLFCQILIDPAVLLTSFFFKINLKVCVWEVCMFTCMYVKVCVWEVGMFTCVQVHTCRCLKKASDSLDLELQVVVSHLTKVLGTKLGSSERACP